MSDKLQFVARHDKVKLIGHQTGLIFLEDDFKMFLTQGGLLVRSRFSLGSAMLFVILVSFTLSFPQRTSETNSGMIGNDQIQGKVFFPPGDSSGARPVVKLQSLSSPEITAVTDQDNNFRFTHLRPELYTVIVEAGDGYEQARESVAVGFSGAVPAQGNPGSYAIPFVYQVQIYLQPKRLNSTSAAANISRTAFANVPQPAQGLYQQALENARGGNHAKAIEQLRAAVAQAPKFSLAYSELAAEFLKVHQADEALKTLKEALATNPDDFTLRLNYGIALLNQKDFPAAQNELRVAAQQGHLPAARYYLGLALINQQEFEEAKSEFESLIKDGGYKPALAHKYLAGIYWRNKEYREAANELETYLKLEPKSPDAEKVRSTIKELRKKI
jgi:Tfp pilus assembly protein PilF